MNLPFHVNRRAQAAALADLPEIVAREAGEFYANYRVDGRRWDQVPKSEAMQHAWQEVIRPYLLGMRDHCEEQRRPEGEPRVTDTMVRAFGDAFYGDLAQWGYGTTARVEIERDVKAALAAALREMSR